MKERMQPITYGEIKLGVVPKHQALWRGELTQATRRSTPVHDAVLDVAEDHLTDHRISNQVWRLVALYDHKTSAATLANRLRRLAEGREPGYAEVQARWRTLATECHGHFEFTYVREDDGPRWGVWLRFIEAA